MTTNQLAGPPLTGPNDVPELLLGLAKLALERGFDSVSLGFEYLGADFPAPIGWSLHLTRRDPESVYALTGGFPDTAHERAGRLIVDVQRLHSSQDAEPPTAYVGHWPENAANELGDPRNYLDLDQITRWITAPTALAPAVDDAEQALLLEGWPFFQHAVLNGWTASRTLKRADHLMFLKQLPDDSLTMRAALEVEALNNFYNVEGHPQHRSTGAAVSTGASVSAHLGLEDSTSDAFFSSDKPYQSVQGEKGRERFEALTVSTSPWFVPVAGFDDKTEKWVLPAEATAWTNRQ